jgi:glycosyltransferase involved in cell wall biosynthesis
MSLSRISQGILLRWYRVANPTRRFLVIWRYEGAAAAWRAAWQRLGEIFPIRGRPSFRNAATEELDAGNVVGSTASMAVQAVASPAVRRFPSTLPPTVSVIVRTCNRPALLAQALTSLANQSYSDFEVVVVDDGEAEVEPVLAQLAPFLDLRQARHVRRSGRTAALNSGLAAARGRWITYLDDDDIIYPTHLACLVHGLDETRARAAYANANRVLCWSDAHHDEVVQSLPCVAPDFDLRRLLVDNWIPLMAFIHAADCVDAAGPFDVRLDLFEDWDFLIRVGERYPFAHVPRLTCEYRYRFGPIPDNVRSALRQRERVLEATRQIYGRYPVTDRELGARRQLTLAALQQDIEEVRRVEERTADPVVCDLLITARVGRFQDARALARRYAGNMPVKRLEP